MEQRGGTLGYSTSMYGCQQNWVTGVYWYMTADISSRVNSGLHRLHTQIQSNAAKAPQAHHDAKLQKQTKIFSGFSAGAPEIPTFNWLKTNPKSKRPSIEQQQERVLGETFTGKKLHLMTSNGSPKAQILSKFKNQIFITTSFGPATVKPSARLLFIEIPLWLCTSKNTKTSVTWIFL